jgi:hypothetical protein
MIIGFIGPVAQRRVTVPGLCRGLHALLAVVWTYTCRQACILYSSREINLTPQSMHVSAVGVAWADTYVRKFA